MRLGIAQLKHRKNKPSGGGGRGQGRMLENVARVHYPPGWGERGPRVWETRRSGARSPYVDDRAVEAVTPKATVREGKFRGKVLGIPNRSLAAKPCAGVDSTVTGAEKTEERHGWGTDQ